MIKLILSVLFIFSAALCYTQNTKYFGAKYNIYYNTDIPQTRIGKLQIDLANNHSIFQISKNIDGDSNLDITPGDYELAYIINHKDEYKFIEIDFNSRKVHFKETFKGDAYYIEDVVHNFDWNLDYSEQKRIGTLLCNKSTTHYRGRNYTAWYTLEIPLGYGPYKFHGLPGLIVSISDESKRYAWVLASYQTKSQKPQFAHNEERQSFMSLKEYYSEIRYPSDGNQQSVIQSRLPKGINIISVSSDTDIRKGIEIKFKWEDKSKED